MKTKNDKSEPMNRRKWTNLGESWRVELSFDLGLVFSLVLYIFIVLKIIVDSVIILHSLCI